MLGCDQPPVDPEWTHIFFFVAPAKERDEEEKEEEVRVAEGSTKAE